MKPFNRSIFVLLALLSITQGFSQDSKTDKKTQRDEPKEERGRAAGLRKIGGHSHHWDIDIDEKALEANIEAAIDRAMKSLDVAMEKLDIDMKRVEVNLHRLKEMGPIEINVPDINIDIESIIDSNLKMHRHHVDLDDDNDQHHKDKVKNKSDRKDSKSRD